MTLQVNAKVTLEVELRDLGNWGDDYTIGQIHTQARRAAQAQLQRALAGWAGPGPTFKTIEITTQEVKK